YRGPGTQMLVGDGMPVAGAISGGCLEADVAERANCAAPDSVRVVTYDNRSTEEVVWGLGLGCNGMARILLETLTPASPIMSFWKACLETRSASVVATVFETNGVLAMVTRANFTETHLSHFQAEPGGFPRAAHMEALKV